ncbi:MAG: alpha/beta fold hydrolase [Rhodospirillales bacterium]|nr:alpha/beta fold hydrolase [Rhodospirillales bacterium]
MNKTPLLLLPGLLCDKILWSHQIDTLSDLVDISVADLTRDDTIEAMAARTLSEAPETFALAGLSMGGYVAQEILRQAPERVTRLALIDTSALADSDEQRERRTGFIGQVQEGKFKGVTARLLPMLIHQDRLNDKVLTSQIITMAENIGKDAFIRQQHTIMSRKDGFDVLARVKFPTVVICGRQDTLTPLEQHRAIADAVTGSVLVIIEDSGHLAPLEQPHAVSAAMRYWLQV